MASASEFLSHSFIDSFHLVWQQDVAECRLIEHTVNLLDLFDQVAGRASVCTTNAFSVLEHGKSFVFETSRSLTQTAVLEYTGRECSVSNVLEGNVLSETETGMMNIGFCLDRWLAALLS